MMRLFAVCGFICLALRSASAQSADRWASMTIGLGTAGVTSHTREVYQDSPQAFMRMGYGLRGLAFPLSTASRCTWEC